MVNRSGRRLAWVAAVMGALAAAVLAPPAVDAAGSVRPLTEEEGRLVAQEATAYAEVTYSVGDETVQGVPYVWGGRTTVQAFADGMTGAPDEDGGEERPDSGVDASGLAVNALRALSPDVRFALDGSASPRLGRDASSAVLYAYNVVSVEPGELRAGDLLFFGRPAADDGSSGDAPSVSGVAVITGRDGDRVDFVTASAREGRVIHTFARIGGGYWQDRVLGGGRFLYRTAEADAP